MRVVLLGPYPPPHGGVQTHLVALREVLRENHVECSVINITAATPTGTDGVFYPRHALAVLALLARRRVDILHLHVGGALTPRLLALGLVCCGWPGARA